MGEGFKITKNISFNFTNHYSEWKQFILGLTFNKEEQCIDIDMKRNKYELNLWLVLIGLHIIFLGKSKEIKEEIK